MDFLILFIIFVLGVVVGSFLNVVIFRLDSGDDIVNSRSKCLSCGHLLAWQDLFPVFSFLSLKGKCRYCKARISLQYPLVEIATGILFVVLFKRVFGSFDMSGLMDAQMFNALHTVQFLSLIFIFSALVVIFVFDLRHYIIPDVVIYPAIAVGLIYKIYGMYATSGGIDPNAIAQLLLPAFLAGGFFLFLILITRGKGMGGGDVKLGFLMGLVLGLPNVLLALFVAFVSGAIAGVVLIMDKKKDMKSMVPFGPFLIFGFLIGYFYGSNIISWYWNGILF